jgi:hypothetical protein
MHVLAEWCTEDVLPREHLQMKMYYLGSTFMYYLLPTTYYLQMKMCYLGTPSSAATTENAYPRC